MNKGDTQIRAERLRVWGLVAAMRDVNKRGEVQKQATLEANRKRKTRKPGLKKKQ